jgi:hypothetical protein
MSNLSDKDRLNLQNMVKSYGADDNTKKIRELKHSRKIKENVEIFINLKRKYKRMYLNDKKGFDKIASSHCNFLWVNYTNIYNRLLKDELDFKILLTFIDKLKEIEDGEVDQHEASVDIGKILKQMYIDSALKREKKFEEVEIKKGNKKKVKEKKPVRNISWAKFKSKGLNEVSANNLN